MADPAAPGGVLADLKRPSKDFEAWFDLAYSFYDGDRTPEVDRALFKATVREIVEAERAHAVRAALAARQEP